MRECKYNEINDYKSAFECFKQRFLKDRKSIFNLSNLDTNCKDDENIDKDCCILTEENLNYLIENFVNNGYAGSANSVEKFCYQLTNEHYKETEKIEVDGKKVKQKYFFKKNLNNEQKGAIEILATAIWLWRLPPSNTDDKSRKRAVYEILGLTEDYKDFNLDEDNPFVNKVKKGFAAPGMRYNMNKPNELAYIIKFFQKYLEIENPDAIEILSSEDFNGQLETTTTYKYDVIIKDKKRTFKEPIKLEKEEKAKASISVHNGLLYLFDSDNYEAILSNDHKKAIIKAFKKELSQEENKKNIDEKLKLIKKTLLKKLGNDFSYKPELFFYTRGIRELWQSGLDFKSNTILHGAPGTGKTYMAEESIKIKQKIEKNSEYELVQFHPSYDYEDFVDGIKPVGINSNGQMKFQLKNGLFKQMCIDAFKELKSNPKNPKKFYFIADEINRAELSRVFGELLLCLEEDKRLKIGANDTLVGTKIKTQNSIMWEKDDVVVFVDSRGKILKDSDNKKEWYFGVPENIYFIGTMNDIDRSVDSFDMALRRRFIWKHYSCDYDVILNNYKDEPNSDSYIEICEKLNTYITDAKGLNLGSSYELGHSYFMKPEKLTQDNLDKVWIENIAPLLKEYIRANESNENEIDKLIKSAKKIFKL